MFHANNIMENTFDKFDNLDNTEYTNILLLIS